MLPEGGACFGLTFAFLGAALRNGMLLNDYDESRFVAGPAVADHEHRGAVVVPDKSALDLHVARAGLLSYWSELERFQRPNLLTRTLQAVFEALITLEQDRGTKIGFHYGAIINGFARVLGISVGAPVTWFLQPKAAAGGPAGAAGDGKKTSGVYLLKSVFGRLPDGLFVFTLGRDGDQHATALCKSETQLLWFEPNQGLFVYDISGAEDAEETRSGDVVVEELARRINVYADLASKDSPQRHRGKFYPITGLISVVGDETLLEQLVTANLEP